MLVPNRKSQQVKILRYAFSHHLFMAGWCNLQLWASLITKLSAQILVSMISQMFPFHAIMSGYRMPTGVGFAGAIQV